MMWLKSRFWIGTFNLALAILIASATCAGAAEPKKSSTASSSQATKAPAFRYLRLLRPDTNRTELQIALRRFERTVTGARRPGRTNVVWLVAASHLGETHYYQQLQKHLDAQGLVLYEGVRDGHARGNLNEESNGAAGDLEESGPPVPEGGGGLQESLARALGLAFQLQAVDYRRRHFRNSDLSVARLQEILIRETADSSEGAGAAMQFQVLLALMSGDSFFSAVANAGLGLIGSSPKLRALVRLTLVEMLSQLEDDLAASSALGADTQRLLQVLIHERNSAVVSELKRVLAWRKPPSSISIFYGAAHMPDLEKRLVGELGFRPAGEQWLTAIRVNAAEAGLTDTEIQVIRNLVKWQMQQLQGGAKDKPAK